MTGPVALSCGEPAGIGPEIAARAFECLRGDVDFFLIGDPAHLPPDVPFTEIESPHEACGQTALPVLCHAFDGPLTPG